MNVIELITAMRGGVPERCDFCDEVFTDENYATPEEAGDLACINCVNKWNASHEPT